MQSQFLKRRAALQDQTMDKIQNTGCVNETPRLPVPCKEDDSNYKLNYRVQPFISVQVFYSQKTPATLDLQDKPQRIEPFR